MIKLAHISPFSFMKKAEEKSDINLVLAHLVGDNEYTKFYAASEKYTIMDNSAFELGESFNPEKLLELGKRINADCIVLPDYPKKDWVVTKQAAEEYLDTFKKAGFDVMYVPQSHVGDFEGYMEGVVWALDNPDIDLVGLSILGAPTALPEIPRTEARRKILERIDETVGLLNYPNKIHMLGKLDTVDEILMWKPFDHIINSHDTSAAVWYGMNRLSVKVRKSKFETHVDFEANVEYDETLIEANINYMKVLAQ